MLSIDLSFFSILDSAIFDHDRSAARMLFFTRLEDDSYLLLGTHESRGNVGMSPELLAFLGTELNKQAMVDKERRKAREERALQLTDKKKG